jgi:hypothetical protein
MSKIIIGFSKPKSWFVPFSWAIRICYGTPYSHVYLKWHSESLDVDMIYEASGSMIHFTSPTRFSEMETVIKEYSIDISEETRKKMVKNCILRCGIPYAIKEAVGMGIVRLAKLFGIKLTKNPFGQGQLKSKCSELVYDVLLEILSEEDRAQMVQSIDKDQDLISPLDIDKFLEKTPSAHPITE